MYISILCNISQSLYYVYEVPSHFLHRAPALDSNVNGLLLHQRSGLSENDRVSCRSNSGSLDSMTGTGAAMTERHNGIEETGSGGLQMPIETKGFVNNSDSPKTQARLEVVNNRECLTMEAQFKFVNNNIQGLKLENRFEDEGEEFD